MLTPEERAVLMDVQEQVIALSVQKDEAQQQGDQARVEELDGEIVKLLEQCDALKQTA